MVSYTYRGKELYVDLIILGFDKFHFILNIDWKTRNHVKLEVATTTVSMETLGKLVIVEQYRDDNVLSTYLFTLEVLAHQSEDVEVVSEFTDEFRQIPGLPPRHVVEFDTDLIPDTTLIS